MSDINPNCDGSHCRDPKGEVRVLPLPGEANLMLCRDCFTHEMIWRRQRNLDLCREAQYPIPAWSDLKVYP